MLRDVFSYLGLSSSDAGGATEDQLSSVTDAPKIGHIPPSLQRELAATPKAHTMSVRVVIRGGRRTGKTSLLHRMQGYGEIRQQYIPSSSIQAATILWRPRERRVTGHCEDETTKSAGEGDQCLAKRRDFASENGNADEQARRVAVMSSGLRQEDLQPTKVDLWDVVDRGTCTPLACSTTEKAILTNSFAATLSPMPTDATTVDVYRHCHGVIFLYDPTKYESFAYVVNEVKKVPRHLPVVVCANFEDVLNDDPTALDVPEEERLDFCNSIPPAMSPFILSITGGHEKMTSLQRQVACVPPSFIRMSVKTGFGLRPLHSFFGLVIAYATSLQKEEAVRIAYDSVALHFSDLRSINDEQNYAEFLEWKEEVEKRRKRPIQTTDAQQTPAVAVAAASAKCQASDQPAAPSTTTPAEGAKDRKASKRQARVKSTASQRDGAENTARLQGVLLSTAFSGASAPDEAFFDLGGRDYSEDESPMDRRQRMQTNRYSFAVGEGSDADDDPQLLREESEKRKRSVREKMAKSSSAEGLLLHNSSPSIAAVGREEEKKVAAPVDLSKDDVRRIAAEMEAALREVVTDDAAMNSPVTQETRGAT